MSVINKITDSVNLLTSKVQGRIERRRIISLNPPGDARGNVLISYILTPFLLNPGEDVPLSHTHFWECLQMAKTFLDMGYCVDVIRFDNDVFIPQKKYAFFIETRWNLQRSAPHLDPECIKILHADTAHLLFHNAAEANRLLQLQQRKGLTLIPRRFEMPNEAMEHADCAVVLGNEFTIGTYKYANKPIFRVPISTPVLYPWFEDKDFSDCRRRFLWFGSGGLVHKGLDLLLDAFAEMPDYHLTICGPINKEKDFEAAFEKELYHTPNINTIGWVDVSSQEFLKILNSCVSVIYPSCSEGGGGCVITCMHAGLIPIVSYEASVDVKDDCGIVLENSSVEEIKNTIRTLSSFPVAKLQEMAKNSRDFVRQNHTQENFARVYAQTINEIIKYRSPKKDFVLTNQAVSPGLGA